MTTPDNCQQCAACCFSTLETYVRVTGDDWARLGADAEEWAHFIGHRAYMKMTGRHCVALAMHCLDNGQRGFICTCYDRRPQICQDLERGSPHCAAELERKATVTSRFMAAGARGTC